MAVKLAMLSNVHPLICVAGSGTEHVRTLIDAEKGDVVIDYRAGPDVLRSSLQAAIPPGQKLDAAFDVVTEHGSWNHICSVLDSHTGRLTITLPPAKKDVPEGVEQTATMAASLWKELKSISGEEIGDLGFKGDEGKVWGAVFSRGMESVLHKGVLVPQEVGFSFSFECSVEQY